MYHAFSAGKHKCPGQRVGLVSVKTVATHILSEFSIELVKPTTTPALFNLSFGIFEFSDIKELEVQVSRRNT